MYNMTSLFFLFGMSMSARIVFFISLFFFSVSNFAQSIDCQQKHCMAVVDAGSTGTRLHVYSYDLDETNTPVNISEQWSKKIKPGFAAIKANKATIDGYMTTLFAGAPENSMPIYFYATAGMRLLSPEEQEGRFAYLHNWFHAQSQWLLFDSKTITGSKEGLFGWLAVNYQLGTLNSDDKKTVGVMDMGGASVQITFPVMDGSPQSSDVTKVSVYGRDFKVYVHSFLGLGQTEVTRKLLDTNSCFITGYLLPNDLAGIGDAYLCEKKVSTLVNKVHDVHQTIHPMIEVSSVSKWYAMGGVAYLVKSKPFSFTESQFTNEELLTQADAQACHQQWPDIQYKSPNDEYLYGSCLFASYYYALMVDGYGLEASNPVHLMKNSQNADWTIGVVLQQKS